MNTFRSFFLCLLVAMSTLSASQVWADCTVNDIPIDCGGGGGGIYTDPTIGGGSGGGGGGGEIGGGGGGASGGGAKEPDKPTLDETLSNAIKKAKDLCKKASEDCGSWGSRMTAPQPAGSGFCVNISATYPLIGTSLCIQSVNREVNLNSCANVGCP